ncbi:hypothetical protein D3C76_1067110 [compost metagenome]
MQTECALLLPMRRQGQVLPPGPTLQLGQFRHRQDFILAQLRQEANHRRPVASLLMQALQLTQDLCVMRVALVHRLQGRQGSLGITAIGLQLRVVQGNRQLGLGLALQGTLQQVVTFFVTTLLICGAGSPEVVKQRLALGFRSPMQMTLRAGPATFGQIQLTVLDRHLDPATAIAP